MGKAGERRDIQDRPQFTQFLRSDLASRNAGVYLPASVLLSPLFESVSAIVNDECTPLLRSHRSLLLQLKPEEGPHMS